MKRSIGLLAAFTLISTSVVVGQTSASTLPKVLIDSALERSEHPTSPQELERKAKLLQNANCNSPAADGRLRRFNSPVSVGESIGGTVETIRVTSFAPGGKTKDLNHLREVALSVWNGKFQSSFCYEPWAEMANWFLEARLEFRDGKRGLLITDGTHVALQDHDGLTWFLRLLPAVQ